MAKRKSGNWTDFITTENISAVFEVAKGGLGLLGGVKDMFFGDSGNKTSNDDSFALIGKVNELEKENVLIKYELLEAMRQTLIFRCAVMEMEKALNCSFFVKLVNLFKTQKRFIGDKMDSFIADNKKLENIIAESYENLKSEANRLGINLPQNNKKGV